MTVREAIAILIKVRALDKELHFGYQKGSVGSSIVSFEVGEIKDEVPVVYSASCRSHIIPRVDNPSANTRKEVVILLEEGEYGRIYQT